MKKIFIITGVILVLVLGFFVADHFLNRNVNSYDSSGLSADYREGSLENIENNEDNNDVLDNDCDVGFTEYFVDPTYVQKVGQVGVVHGSGLYVVERSYVSVKGEFLGQRVPVYAPTDMVLVSGSHYQNQVAQVGSLPDYALWFDAGCGIEVNLAHLKEVVGGIAEQLPEVTTSSANIRLKRIEFKAGELIGYFIYKQGDVAGFDFIVRDRKFVNSFINQERYSDGRADNLINGVCPYDLYTGEKKEAYYNLLGGGGGTVFKVKDCGTSSRDKAGTISGMWFLDKEVTGWIYDTYDDGEYGSTLSIIGDEERVTIGNLGKSNTLWVYSNMPTYKLPEEVITEHCYQFSGFNPTETNGWAYFKIIDDATIDVYYSPTGSCPSSMPSGAKRYYK